MDVRQQIKILCAYSNITQKELAHRLGWSQQNLSNKMRRGKLTATDLERIAEATHCTYVSYFLSPNGDKIL